MGCEPENYVGDDGPLGKPVKGSNKDTKIAALTKERDEAVRQRRTDCHGVAALLNAKDERIAALEVLLGACSLEIRKSAESSIYALADNIDRALAGEKVPPNTEYERLKVVCDSPFATGDDIRARDAERSGGK
jgi:hypothetical protein